MTFDLKGLSDAETKIDLHTQTNTLIASTENSEQPQAQAERLFSDLFKQYYAEIREKAGKVLKSQKLYLYIPKDTKDNILHVADFSGYIDILFPVIIEYKVKKRRMVFLKYLSANANKTFKTQQECSNFERRQCLLLGQWVKKVLETQN